MVASTVKLAIGDTVNVTSERLSQFGDGVAVVGGSEIRVGDLLPGERAVVRIESLSRRGRRVLASVVERYASHPGRRTAPCPHHGKCTGCPAMGMTPEQQARYKSELVRTRIGRSPDVLVTGAHERYRHASRRLVTPGSSGPVLGGWIRNTAAVASMEGCLLDHPDITACIDELERVIVEQEIAAYDEDTERGDLRAIDIKTDGRGGVLLTLVTAEPCSRAATLLPSRLSRPLGIAWAVDSGRENSSGPVTVRPLRGPQTLAVEVAGHAVHVGPLTPLRPNLPIVARAYEDTLRVPAGGFVRGRRAAVLHAGMGVLPKLLQSKFDQVFVCEPDPEGAKIVGLAPELAEDFLATLLRHPELRDSGLDLFVLHPPRGGLGSMVCAQLRSLRPARLHVLSSDLSALASDLGQLTQRGAGSYRLIGVRAYDVAPQTLQLDVLAWLVAR